MAAPAEKIPQAFGRAWNPSLETCGMLVGREASVNSGA
jgi:hypothetical protein